MSNFYQMFATPPLMEVTYEGSLDSFVEGTKQLSYRDSFANSVSTNTYVLELPEFKPLEQFFKDGVKEYTSQVLQSDDEITIQQSWINLTERNKHHPKHYHMNSYLSGVFFIQSTETVAPIIFDCPNTHNFPMRPEPRGHISNEFVNDSYTCAAKAGTLLVFPSNIPHWVPVNPLPETRISLSFNTFPKIPFGSVESSTRLT